MIFSQKDIARFLSKVTKTESCWLWTGAIKHNGYGRFRLDGKIRNAHRVSWSIFNGIILEDQKGGASTNVVMHSCDNRKCVNPKHLILATQTENMRDAVRKGRLDSRVGERNARCTISEEIAKKIKSLVFSKSVKELTEMFNVSSPIVNNIKYGNSWKTI